MKKVLLLVSLMAAAFAVTSCASKGSAEDAEAAGPSQARIAALEEEGALDLAEFKSADTWAIKYDEAAYTLTVKGAEMFHFELPQEVIPNEDILTVHLTGVNKGKEGFRVWIDTGAQQDLSDPQYLGCVGDALPAGDFDVTFELNANKGAGGTCLWLKGPRWGTPIDNVVFKSVSVIYN
ncbi:MAG: hypothetical protein K5829_04090 [Treponema sp.]|nr:hypothetical protein [Treponema sp.]